MALPPALSGAVESIDGRAGRIVCYSAGSGTPLLLVHSVNAAASAYEMRPIFERLNSSHRVYALDLPGFGLSDRSARNYTPALFTDAIHDASDFIARQHGPVPIDAVALSLPCEFLARAVAASPERYRRLVLITPTGFQRNGSDQSAAADQTREIAGLKSGLSLPGLSDLLYGGLVSRPSIRYFLKRTFGSSNFDEALVDYCYRTAHEPGAKNAPLAFLSGGLFSRNPRALYERLTQPIWMPHATRGDFGDFSEAGWVDQKNNWTRQPFPAGAMLHFEQPEVFAQGLLRFLADERQAHDGNAAVPSAAQ